MLRVTEARLFATSKVQMIPFLGIQNCFFFFDKTPEVKLKNHHFQLFLHSLPWVLLDQSQLSLGEGRAIALMCCCFFSQPHRKTNNIVSTQGKLEFPCLFLPLHIFHSLFAPLPFFLLYMDLFVFCKLQCSVNNYCICTV